MRGWVPNTGMRRSRTVALCAFVLLVAPVGLGGGGVAAARDFAVAQPAPSSEPSPSVVPSSPPTATPPVPGEESQLLPASPETSQLLTGGATPTPTSAPTAEPPTVAPTTTTAPPAGPPSDTPGRAGTGTTSRALLVLVVIDVIVVLAALFVAARRKREPRSSLAVPEPAESRGRTAAGTAPLATVHRVAPKSPARARAAAFLPPDVTRPWGEGGLRGWLPADVAGVGDAQPAAAAVALPVSGISPRLVGTTDQPNPDARQIFVLAVNEASLRLWLPAAAVARAGDPLRVHGSAAPFILTGRPEDQQGGAARLSAGGAGAPVVLVGGPANRVPRLSRDVRGVLERPRERVGGRV